MSTLVTQRKVQVETQVCRLRGCTLLGVRFVHCGHHNRYALGNRLLVHRVADLVPPHGLPLSNRIRIDVET